ncbi:hypothetical protein MNBD_PLANCTO02-1365 [hydrothermal vent metagenome]|uniref:Uncharacterized protein n=1 Tax=hydrothermal vent metagenome TaxID=652676 RepID=A0A3B1D6C5_9ZZZZ
MPGKAAKVIISERQQEVLQTIIKSPTASQQLMQRVKIILLAFEGWLNEKIAPELSVDEMTGYSIARTDLAVSLYLEKLTAYYLAVIISVFYNFYYSSSSPSLVRKEPPLINIPPSHGVHHSTRTLYSKSRDSLAILTVTMPGEIAPL